MRVLSLNFSKSPIVEKSIQKYIYIDALKDLDDTEYHLMIRSYDLILVFVDSDKDMKKYLNILKKINSIEQSYKFKIFFTKSGNSTARFIKDNLKNYKNIEAEFTECFSQQESNELLSITIKKFFYETPELISHIKYDLKKQILNLTLSTGNFEIKIESKRHMYILIYMLRHYGETLSIDTILSGTTKEPELTSKSPIEAAISSLRDLFSKININDSITNFKKIGYRLEI